MTGHEVVVFSNYDQMRVTKGRDGNVISYRSTTSSVLSFSSGSKSIQGYMETKEIPTLKFLFNTETPGIHTGHRH